MNPVMESTKTKMKEDKPACLPASKDLYAADKDGWFALEQHGVQDEVTLHLVSSSNG